MAGARERLGRIPSNLQIDRRDRGTSSARSFRRYEGASVEVSSDYRSPVGESSQKGVPRRSAGSVSIAPPALTFLITCRGGHLRSTVPLFDLLIGCELEVRTAGTPGSWRRHRSSARRRARGSGDTPSRRDRPESSLRYRLLHLPLLRAVATGRRRPLGSVSIRHRVVAMNRGCREMPNLGSERRSDDGRGRKAGCRSDAARPQSSSDRRPYLAARALIEAPAWCGAFAPASGEPQDLEPRDAS